MAALLDDYLTEAETAVQLGRNPRTLKRWRDLGEGPAYTRIGRSIYYRREAVQTWLARQECAA